MNVINQSPYLRSSWLFPEEIGQLTVELQRSYTAIQENVNARTIGLFPTNRPAVGGERWFVNSNQNQQSLRQVYPFTLSSATISIPTNINFNSITNFVRIWGTFYDGTYWDTLPYVDVTAITNQIQLRVQPVTIGTFNTGNIIVTRGTTAPTITSGLIILEWISVP